MHPPRKNDPILMHLKGLNTVQYFSAKETAARWGVSGQFVRRYCKEGRIPGAILSDNGWMIPDNTEKPGASAEPQETTPTPLVKRIAYQRERNNHFDVYEYIQINLAYSSSRMASNRMTLQQVEEAYRTGKVSIAFEPLKVDDMIEIVDHFACMRYVVDNVTTPLSHKLIKDIHRLLTYGTSADHGRSVTPGEYRKQPDKIGVAPAEIHKRMDQLLKEYELRVVTLEQILEFHVRFERVRPFDDYNGRVGRVIMLKECLRHNVPPFIIDDKRRSAYNRGIAQWDTDKSILMEAVRQAQARTEQRLDTIRLLQRRRRR